MNDKSKNKFLYSSPCQHYYKLNEHSITRHTSARTGDAGGVYLQPSPTNEGKYFDKRKTTAFTNIRLCRYTAGYFTHAGVPLPDFSP